MDSKTQKCKAKVGGYFDDTLVKSLCEHLKVVILNTCEYTTDFKRSHYEKNNALEAFIRNQFSFSPCVRIIAFYIAVMDVCRQQKVITQHEKIKINWNNKEVRTQAKVCGKLNLSKTTQNVIFKDKVSFIDLFEKFRRKMKKKLGQLLTMT